jgi:hypothetical protein
MTPKQRPRFKLRPPAPPPRPPKHPRAQGVTLDTLRKRMFAPFYPGYEGAVNGEAKGLLSKYFDTPISDATLGTPPGPLTMEHLDAARRNFEPPAPVFVPPGTALRDDLGRLPEPGDLPKRSRKDIASDIENTTINIHTAKGRQERETMRARLRDLFRELDELDKP